LTGVILENFVSVRSRHVDAGARRQPQRGALGLLCDAPHKRPGWPKNNKVTRAKLGGRRAGVEGQPNRRKVGRSGTFLDIQERPRPQLINVPVPFAPFCPFCSLLLVFCSSGFMHEANLDEGAMWPIAFALKELTAAEEAKIGALVKKAVS
jgi:hypothetical protein